ncbi:MAG: UbiA-like polyprenyltransferase [Planctomycetota bacterium]
MSEATPNAPRSLSESMRAIAGDIKLAHSVFALPFAVLGMVWAAGWRDSVSWPAGVLGVAWWEIGLVVVCMVSARTVAMTMNRWADRRIDAGNPRTAGRAIPAGRVSANAVLWTGAAASAIFVVACGGFGVIGDNWWPARLSVPVLLWLAGYAYAKRFTALCHVVLGVALAMSPVAAALAIDPGYVVSEAGRGVWWLAGFVLLWVAGFDVIYATADEQFDKQEGLHSLPAALGTGGALWVSRAMHLAALACLIVSQPLYPVEGRVLPWLIGVALTAGLLVTEHAIVWRAERRHDPKLLDAAFFIANGVIAVVLGACGLVSLIVA